MGALGSPASPNGTPLLERLLQLEQHVLFILFISPVGHAEQMYKQSATARWIVFWPYTLPDGCSWAEVQSKRPCCRLAPTFITVFALQFSHFCFELRETMSACEVCAFRNGGKRYPSGTHSKAGETNQSGNNERMKGSLRVWIAFNIWPKHFFHWIPTVAISQELRL